MVTLIAGLGVFASVTGMLVPFLSGFWALVATLWLYLFVGACMLTLMMGVQIALVEPGLRPMSNSFANFLYNLLGWIPAPMVYGYVT